MKARQSLLMEMQVVGHCGRPYQSNYLLLKIKELAKYTRV